MKKIVVLGCLNASDWTKVSDKYKDEICIITTDFKTKKEYMLVFDKDTAIDFINELKLQIAKLD
jgi:hypothetical protein